MGKSLIVSIPTATLSALAMYGFFFFPDIRAMQTSVVIMGLVFFAIIALFGVGIGLLFDYYFSKQDPEFDDFIKPKK